MNSYSNSFPVLNPATELTVGEAPDLGGRDLDAVFASASGAQRSWATDEQRRRDLLRVAAGVVGDLAGDLALLLTAEQGKPLRDSTGEVAAAAAWFEYFADLEVPEEVFQDDGRVRARANRRPLGVVAAITPWNYPVMLACWKLAPALRAGNTVVLKPSPYTPLSSIELGRALASVLPPGVLQVVTGRDPLGAAITSHPVPRKVSFTGSVATGRLVASAAADDLKRITLELGGNDAAILLDDVDVAAVAKKLFWGAFQNNGQTCSAIKRLLVPEALEANVVEALADIASSTQVGDGSEPGTRLGPLNNAAQRDRVAALVDATTAAGGKVVVGGRPLDRPGWFYEPTIVSGTRPGMPLVEEEQFGPALPVVTYRDEAEALELANATDFGLSGSVWSADPERAEKMAAELRCGTAWVNSHITVAPHLPFGGWGHSGIGVENHLAGLRSFTELQVLHSSLK